LKTSAIAAGFPANRQPFFWLPEKSKLWQTPMAKTAQAEKTTLE
jgi:hypothetical protein